MSGEDTDKFLLSAEKLGQAVSWLKTKWKDGKCPFCGASDWQVSSTLASIRCVPPMAPGSLHLGGPTFPAIAVTCGNCGQMTLVNAIISGVVELPKEGSKNG